MVTLGLIIGASENENNEFKVVTIGAIVRVRVRVTPT
jgi:hypothetical protein